MFIFRTIYRYSPIYKRVALIIVGYQPPAILGWTEFGTFIVNKLRGHDATT